MKKKAIATAILLAVLAVAGLTALYSNSLSNLAGGNLTPSESALKSKDINVFNSLQRDSLDPRVNSSSTFFNYASQDFLNLGLFGNVSVNNPGLGTYKQEPLTNPTIDFFSNYSLAVHQLNLPQHSNADIFRIGNMSQNNPDVVNFNPIRLQGNSNYVDITPTPSREAWSPVDEAKHINDSGYDLMNHPRDGTRP